MRALCGFLLIVGWLVSPSQAEERLLVGVAEVDITPPIPYRMSGYFSERVSTGIKDPLKAKAIVFVQGSTQAAIVFCDLIGMSRDVVQRTRAAANAATGIPATHIAIAATHSHTGPLYFGALRKFFHERSAAHLGEDRYEQVDYPNLLETRLVQALGQALATAQPAELHWLCKRTSAFLQSALPHARRIRSFQSRPTEPRHYSSCRPH